MSATSSILLRSIILLAVALAAAGCATPRDADTPQNLEYVQLNRPFGPPTYFYRPAQPDGSSSGPGVVLSRTQ